MYGIVLLGTIAATGFVALMHAVSGEPFAVVAPQPYAAAPIIPVAIILAVISLVVIPRKPAAVAIVAVTNVAQAPAVNPVKPAAVQYVALVVVAVLPDAVAPLVICAVTI